MKTINVKNVVGEFELNEKKEKVRKKSILKEVFTDYCSSTSLHGIGYLGAQDKSFAEKVWWIIVFILSLFVCIYLITRTWIKWTNDPVILSFEKEQIPIWDIPFPAVTICPINKVKRRSYNYTEKFRMRDNLKEGESKKFWDISLVCNLEQYEVIASFNCTFNTTDEKAIHNIVANAPSNDTVTDVKWQNKRLYEDVFVNQITEEGLCFTFNSFRQKDMYTEVVNTTIPFISNTYEYYDKNIDWSPEQGYKHEIQRRDYPRRTTKDGIASGLSFALYSVAEDIDYVCGMPISGYKIILHNPAEVPKAAQQYFLVPEGKKANIVVKPELTKTSKSLRSLPAETRKCYFSDEKSLKYFKVYTQSNCRMECNTNITLQYCNCVPFYLPREVNTTICGFGSEECMKEVERTILHIEMLDKGINLFDKELVEITTEIYNKCHCLPSCNSLEYSAEISQSEYHLIKTQLATGLLDKSLKQDVIDKLNQGLLVQTQVDIFFKESQFYALKRSEIYGRVDFLANVGGLLGLFMGFSLLSLIEIIYFLTIRIWFMCKSSNTVK